MGFHEELVVSLRTAARELAATRSIRDVQETLTQIVRSAVQTVPGADAGGISVAEDGIIASRNPTSSSITELDQLQSSLGEGPCISAIIEPAEDGVIIAQDLAGEDADRWPRFAPRAVEAGYHAMLSTQLANDEGLRAALNLYAEKPRVFDDEARLTAGLFGVQAALLLYGSQSAANLQRAVDSRDVIGQAKGILMERFTVDGDEAFEMLVRSSQETNVKLVEVARWLDREAAGRRAERGPAAPSEH